MMKKIILWFNLSCLISINCFAQDFCFLAKEYNHILKHEGHCSARFTPQSTFKIPLSLMGYDVKVLTDKEHPKWQYKENDTATLAVCKKAHTPRTWMRDSCVWYSQVLTQKLGQKKFYDYVKKFEYGNQDVSGDREKNNGLTHAWLTSSLAISPQEQVEFLQKFVEGQLPVSVKAQEMAKKIMFLQELPGGWKLYGKTGSGQQMNANGLKTDLQHGWFVGFIQKGTRTIVFASHLQDDQVQHTYASLRAKNEAMLRLWDLIDSLEK